MIIVGYPEQYGQPSLALDSESEIQVSVTFTVCMAMKTLRLAHAGEVVDVFKRLNNKLQEVFYLKRLMFVNIHNWMMAGL
jgi:hypothetical protein